MRIEALREIAARQRENCDAIDEQLRIIAENDLVRENSALRAELEDIKSAHATASAELKKLREESSGLKNALYEQIYNERLGILNGAAKKTEIYFKSAAEGELNSLARLEASLRRRINAMHAALCANRADINGEISGRLDEISLLVDERLALAREQATKSIYEDDEFERLRHEQITEEQIKAVAKKNNFESFIGLNILNRLGILLIVLGVIAASQFAYFRLPDLLKGIMMFGLGAVMLAAGELLNRKKANVFSLGLTAGGVAVLYTALSVSYFFLEILPMYPAIALCALITAGAFVLSTRHNSQTVASFALIGGYLPIISISEGLTLIYAAMAYFAVLNVLALMLSFHKKWSICAFIGLFLNIAGTAYIYFSVGVYPAFTVKLITLSYMMFAFAVYSLIPLIGAYRARTGLTARDVVFIAVNTFFSSLIVFIAFYGFDLEDYGGILAVAFAAFYVFAAKLSEAKLNSGKKITALFYLTGLAFAVLTIPLQFGVRWLSLGWLAEGLTLTVYGVINRERSFKRFGFIINGLCLSSFLFFDLLLDLDYLFMYKYCALTAGGFIILLAFAYTKELSGRLVRVFKYLTIVNLYIFFNYLILDELYYSLSFKSLNDNYFCSALALASVFCIAYFSARSRAISDQIVRLISCAAYALGIFGVLLLNTNELPLNMYFSAAPMSLVIGGTVLTACLSLLSVLALYDLLRFFVVERKLGVELLPLIISAYFVTILTQSLVFHYDLDFSSTVITLIYAFTALAWIAFGFYRRYSFIRLFGLALSILAVFKLFIIDLSELTEGFRIISYFALGATLVAISFIYQYFNKRLELKVRVTDEETDA